MGCWFSPDKRQAEKTYISVHQKLKIILPMINVSFFFLLFKSLRPFIEQQIPNVEYFFFFFFFPSQSLKSSSVVV